MDIEIKLSRLIVAGLVVGASGCGELDLTSRSGSQALGITIYDLGTSAPPPSIDGVTMTAFPPDNRTIGDQVSSVPSPLGGDVNFGASLSHRRIGAGWATWSHGYQGDVYYTNGAATTTLTMPAGTSAFYLYVEPNPFASFDFIITASDGSVVSSGPMTIDGDAGARGFAFTEMGGNIQSIGVSSNIDFAIGEFGIARASQTIPAPGAGPLVSPFTEPCKVIRDFQQHLDDDSQPDNEAGVDYQISAEQLSPYDPLTRDPANMSRRVVRAVAAGTIVDILRLGGNGGNESCTGDTTFCTPALSVSPDIQAAEVYGILINVLSENSESYLLAQYVHVFPTQDWVTANGAALDFPAIADYTNPGNVFDAEDVAYARGTSTLRSYSYVNLPRNILGRRSTGVNVQQGEELGFYAQIGRSTLPEGPHLHVSLFTLPKSANADLNAWLRNPTNTGIGGQILDPGEYIPCQ